jgi:hypothetical protein
LRALKIFMLAMALVVAGGAQASAGSVRERRVQVRSSTVGVPVACPQSSRGGCSVQITLVARGRRIARTSLKLLQGEWQTVRVRLNAAGRSLHRAHHAFAATVKVERTLLACDPVPSVPAGPVGMTGITGGIALVGGPDGCTQRPFSPGTVTAADAATGIVVATTSVAAAKTFTLALAAGTYTVTGSTPDANIPCRVDGPVTVTEGKTTTVIVICSIK